MCLDPTVSLGTFTVGCVSFFALYATGGCDCRTLIILMSFTLTHLLDLFTWIYIDDAGQNLIFSVLGLLLIIAQLFILNLFNPVEYVRNIGVLVLTMSLAIFLSTELNHIRLAVKIGANGHLVWKWIELSTTWTCIALILYVFPLIFYAQKTEMVLVTTTLITSLYNNHSQAWPNNMSCWLSNGCWLYLVFSHTLTKRAGPKIPITRLSFNDSAEIGL